MIRVSLWILDALNVTQEGLHRMREAREEMDQRLTKLLEDHDYSWCAVSSKAFCKNDQLLREKKVLAS